MSEKLLLVFFLAAVVGVSGCTSDNPVYSGEAGELEQVQSITTFFTSVKGWDADPEDDGIEFILTPKDSGDRTVRTDGTLKASLYETKGTYGDYEKGALITDWTVQVSEDNYRFSRWLCEFLRDETDMILPLIR